MADKQNNSSLMGETKYQDALDDFSYQDEKCRRNFKYGSSSSTIYEIPGKCLVTSNIANSGHRCNDKNCKIFSPYFIPKNYDHRRTTAQ